MKLCRELINIQTSVIKNIINIVIHTYLPIMPINKPAFDQFANTTLNLLELKYEPDKQDGILFHIVQALACKLRGCEGNILT